MIPSTSIVAWRTHVPWVEDAQVEQDLVLSRALVDIFSHPELRQNLAFRGGTALHKIFFHPPGRYSEDIDLCRTTVGPAGAILNQLRETLDPWFGTPRIDRTNRAVTLRYKFLPEAGGASKRVKVEINVREHYNVFGLVTIPYEITNPWYSGRAEIVTYSVEELLATKLRALYQRKKGRDLFDLYQALVELPQVNTARLLEGFNFYMSRLNLNVSRAEFERNLELKQTDPAFRSDITALLPAGSEDFDFDLAYAMVSEEIISRLL